VERRKGGRPAKTLGPFDAHAFLESAGAAKTIVQYARGEAIYKQGDPCEHVMYIQSGAVKLSVLSESGKEAVIAMLDAGDFFGEGCLAGQPVRMGSATAAVRSTVLRIAKAKMVQLLHKQAAMSDRFIAHMLARNIRFEQDLVDQLFNSSEKRLARTLLLLYAADLAFRLRWQIRPALAEGRTVVAAPYVDTALAFGRAAGLKPSWLMNLFRFAPRPGTRRFVHARPADAAAVKGGFVGFSGTHMAADTAARRKIAGQTAVELRRRFDRSGRR